MGTVWTGPSWQSGWESGRRPCGWQARFWVAGGPSSSGPLPPCSLRASPARDERAAHWPPLCRNQPGADGTRDQRPVPRAPILTRTLPGSVTSAPRSPHPPDDTRIGTPVSWRRRQVPLADDKVGQLTGSLDRRQCFLGWGWGWGEEARGASPEGLGAPGRQEGTGRPWLGPRGWWGQPSGASPRHPFFGGPGPIF